MISSVYDYYLSTYGRRITSRHDSHKKSELNAIYNNMVKINKASPVYKVDMSESSQKLAIDIKEASHALINTLGDITDVVNGTFPIGDVAITDNPDVAEAKYIGNGSDKEDITFDVEQLATPQINISSYLPTGSRMLFAGDYNFEIETGGLVYEVQFTVTPEDNNSSVQDKLARLINRSNMGIIANTVTNPLGHKALKLTSEATGSPEGSPLLFKLIDTAEGPVSSVVSAFGLDRVSQYPSNAVFDINGEQALSQSNSFTVDNKFEVRLNGLSSEHGKAHITMMKDSSAIKDELKGFTEKYNRLLSLSEDKTTYEMRKFNSDIVSITKKYKESLTQNGIDVADDYSLLVNDKYFDGINNNGDIMESLNNISAFKNELSEKVKTIDANPMEYVNKKIVAYKNPAKLITTPYNTSMYAGMMFNGYI